MKPKKVRHYGVQCSRCKERLFSLSVHDYHFCSCQGTFIDGGVDYIRTGWNTGLEKPRSIYRLVTEAEYKKMEGGGSWPY